MKALILAAGFGTRLRPYTNFLPKPLFPIGGKPVLGITIEKLRESGISEIVVNTHHLHEKIESYIKGEDFGIPVHAVHEETILDTGGAVKNTQVFWGDDPFLIINGDVLMDLDLGALIRHHKQKSPAATLVLHHKPEFNKVVLNKDGNILNFEGKEPDGCQTLAFTGVHILDPLWIKEIPEGRAYGIIDLYRTLIKKGIHVNGYLSRSHTHWFDIGTPGSYMMAAQRALFAKTIARDFSHKPAATALSGDGSDRTWHRVTCGDKSMIMAGHGIREQNGVAEVDAFVSIGNHLKARGVNVPLLHGQDLFSGQVMVEDLGDMHLQQHINSSNDAEKRASTYKKVFETLIDFSIDGKVGFDTGWCHQSPSYDRELILEKECRYFTEAFLNGYMGLDVKYETLSGEFEKIADLALKGAFAGLMHRDFQSRNIMMMGETPYVIDFQGARPGPIQYDLASLLIDPYVNLSKDEQKKLYNIFAVMLMERTGPVGSDFHQCYRFCRITRNLQMLGAFGFLSRVKGKKTFEAHIPAAVANLKSNSALFQEYGLKNLETIVKAL